MPQSPVARYAPRGEVPRGMCVGSHTAGCDGSAGAATHA
eukprot:gene52831-53681_t